MKNSSLAVNEILIKSFQFIFANLTSRLKDGFMLVILITISFNILNALMANALATNFTILLFIFFSMLLMSSIGISVHKEILSNYKQSFFSEFLSLKNIKYFINIFLITLVAIFPLLLHFLLKISNKIEILGLNISYLFILWIFTCILSLKFIFILPKIALDYDFKYSFSELNTVGAKLFVIFFIITVFFFIPSVIILSLQIALLNSYSQIYVFVKPIFDFISFYISYLNYLVIFAAISFAYKKTKS